MHGQTRYLADEDGEFVVQVQNAYVRDWLHSRLRYRMTAILSRPSRVRLVMLKMVERVEQEQKKPNSSGGRSEHSGPYRHRHRRTKGGRLFKRGDSKYNP